MLFLFLFFEFFYFFEIIINMGAEESLGGVSRVLASRPRGGGGVATGLRLPLRKQGSAGRMLLPTACAARIMASPVVSVSSAAASADAAAVITPSLGAESPQLGAESTQSVSSNECYVELPSTPTNPRAPVGDPMASPLTPHPRFRHKTGECIS